MPDEHYRMAIDLSRAIAAEVGTPRFYLEKEREVALSRELFRSEPLAAAGLSLIAGRDACLGHGISHVEKVAVDSGALVLIEAGAKAADARIRRLVLLAQLAGILHDISRSQRNHAERGAEEVTTLLAGLALESDESAGIVNAIRNHEAFRPCHRSPDREGQLLSDVLYDADKFRWGPDNFTETLWAMVAPRGLPLPVLLPRLLPGIEGVGRIRDTFRTPTGKQYGPDFIDRGVAIGRRLHAALSARFT
ncbi:MAG: HD domain-containing protein [Syntrophales bacterium]